MKYFSFLFLILISTLSNGQRKITKDLDGDLKNDSVYLDYKKNKIICKLSTQNYNLIESREIEMAEDFSNLKSTKNGFEFKVFWMRAGYQCQFRFDNKTKKIQLIGMSRYEDGPASNDGSGESSINLLTNSYIGNWNYFDLEKEELIKIPTIKIKMILTKTFLENFDENIYFKYSEKCSKLFETNKRRIISTKKQHLSTNSHWKNWKTLNR